MLTRNGDERQVTRDGIYHIRVRGNLDEKWADWFGGFVMTSRSDGQTLLSGAVADQAALHGVLGQLHSLGLPLVLVARTRCPCPKEKCERRGQCHECAAYHGAKGQLPFCFRERTKWDKHCAAVMQAR